MKQIYAEDINYWQSSKTDPDNWIDRAVKLIASFGGKVLATGYGSEPSTGRAAYMLEFQVASDRFKVIWPVLKPRSGNERAARIQAATMLFHDIKGSLIKVSVFGARAAFAAYLLLPDGRTVAQATNAELAQSLPALFAPKPPPGLVSGEDVVEGEWSQK
jgi:hypothetical protein